MGSEQKFATFISRASKGRVIGSVLSWLAAVLLIVALFVPGFRISSTGSAFLDEAADSLVAFAGEVAGEDDADLERPKVSPFSYLLEGDKSFIADASEQPASNVTGILLLVLFVVFILCSIIFALFTMNVLAMATTFCAIAELILAALSDAKVNMTAPLIVLLVLAAILQIVGVILHYTIRSRNDNEWEDDWADYGNGAQRDDATGLAEDDRTAPIDTGSKAAAAVLVQMNTSREFTLPGNGEAILGKGSQANIIIANPVISRAHAKISRQNGVSMLQDLNSKNGTYLNDQKLAPGQSVRLTNGAYITLGNEMFLYKE